MSDSPVPRPKHSWPGANGALSLRDAEDVGSALNVLKNLNF
ncbi:pro-head protease [Salmonella phage 118970_sal3]|nr:pro-head protease [Salmonella phage 118970_sal3]AOP04149.1 pro-head protease [Salmonella phage 118970_sal3]